jgi:hypothetical protein
VKRRWTTLIVTGIYLGVGSCFVWWRTGVTPLAMIHDILEAPLLYWTFTGSHNLVTLAGKFGMDQAVALKILAPSVAAIGLGILIRWRNAPMIDLFAIAAIADRLWTYHRFYDNIILVFLLAAIGGAVVRNPKWVGVAILIGLGSTLWLPQQLASDSSGLGVRIWLPMIVVSMAATAGLLSPILRPRVPSSGEPVGTPVTGPRMPGNCAAEIAVVTGTPVADVANIRRARRLWPGRFAASLCNTRFAWE